MRRKLYHPFIQRKVVLPFSYTALLFVVLISNHHTTFAQYTDTAMVYVEAPLNVSTFSTTIEKPHSPVKATWMSVALPGLGQAYNKQYWKIPIIYAGIGIITYLAIDNYKGAQKFKKEYIQRENGDTSAFDPGYLNYSNTNIYNLYYSYQKNFELTLIVGGVIYLLNILDAYVFAHLYTFELNEDLTLNITPIANYETIGSLTHPQIGLNMKFSLKNKSQTKGKRLFDYGYSF